LKAGHRAEVAPTQSPADKKRKVVVCSTHVFWSSHCERDLELIQQHIDAGDEVTRLVCQTEFDRCDNHLALGPNPTESEVQTRCVGCIDKLKRSQKLIEGPHRNVRYADLPQWERFVAPAFGPFKTVEELQAFEWNGFDAGMAVGSSLISYARVTRPDVVPYGEVIDRTMRSALRLYSSFRAFLAREKPDVVFVLNGRFTHTRALFRACQQEGIRCMIHEMGSRMTHYGIFENAMPHNRAYFARQAKAMWAERAADPTARDQASRWFEDRARGADQAWFSFTKNHDPSLLPDEWDSTRAKFVVFTSSEDEFAAIGPDWKNDLFPRQLDGIRILSKLVGELRPDADLVIRMHPNLAGTTDPEVTSVTELAGPGVIVIPPESRVSSYGLLHAAEVVLTFGSTIGMEAVFWGKPSILLGPTIYDGLGGMYRPASVQDLRALLSGRLAPLDREVALMFGFYAGNFGQPYRYYEPTGLVRGRYRGVDLDSDRSVGARVRAGLKIAATAVVGSSLTAAILRRYRRFAGVRFT
jgi:hypothetical protein